MLLRDNLRVTRSLPLWGNVKRFIASPALLNLMYVPALVFFALFLFYPLTQGLKWSLTNWNGYSEKYAWVGLEQYVQLVNDPKTLHTLGNTLIYGLGSTLFQNLLGLGYAVLLNSQLRGRSIVRMIVYFPVIISPLIMG